MLERGGLSRGGAALLPYDPYDAPVYPFCRGGACCLGGGAPLLAGAEFRFLAAAAPTPATLAEGDSSSDEGIGGACMAARLFPREGTDRLLDRAYCEGREPGRGGGSFPFA